MDAQVDLSLRWVHTHFVGFVMSWLTCVLFANSDTVAVPLSKETLPVNLQIQVYRQKKKNNAYSKTYQFFSWTIGVIPVSFTSFLKHAIDRYISHFLFLEVKTVGKKIIFKSDGGQFSKSQKSCVFVMPSLSMRVSNRNRPYKPRSSQRLVL